MAMRYVCSKSRNTSYTGDSEVYEQWGSITCMHNCSSPWGWVTNMWSSICSNFTLWWQWSSVTCMTIVVPHTGWKRFVLLSIAHQTGGIFIYVFPLAHFTSIRWLKGLVWGKLAHCKRVFTLQCWHKIKQISNKWQKGKDSIYSSLSEYMPVRPHCCSEVLNRMTKG